MNEFKSLLQTPHPSLFIYSHFYPSALTNQEKGKKKIKNKKTFNLSILTGVASYPIPYLSRPFSVWSETRVFIGFSFNPMLSGDRSSGEMQDGLSGLLGLSLSR